MIKPVQIHYYHVLVFTHGSSRDLQYLPFLSVWDLDYCSGVWFSWAKAARPRYNSAFVRSTWKLSDACRRWTLLKVNCNPWASALCPQRDNVMKSCGTLKYELIIGLIPVFFSQIQFGVSLYSCVVHLTMLVTGFMAALPIQDAGVMSELYRESFHLVWGGRVGWVKQIVLFV